MLSHEISADLKAGGERAAAARERIRALLVECGGLPRRVAERVDASRWTVMRWLEARPDLDRLAKKLREQSGEADARMAKARSARRKPKK